MDVSGIRLLTWPWYVCSETARVEELEIAGRDKRAREYNVPSLEDVEKELAVAPDLPTIKQRVQVG